MVQGNHGIAFFSSTAYDVTQKLNLMVSSMVVSGSLNIPLIYDLYIANWVITMVPTTY